MKKRVLLNLFLVITLVVGAGANSSLLAAKLTLESNANCTQMAVGSDDTLAVGPYTLAITGATDINGTMTISTGTVDAGGAFNATNGAITFSDAGSLELAGSVTSLGTFTAGASTVTYDGDGNQTVAAEAYYNLTLSGSGTKTVDMDSTTISGSKIISDAAQVALTATATGINKAYDGTTDATVTLNPGNTLFSDYTVSASGNAVFASSNVGDNIEVNVSGITLTGADADKFSLSSTTASTTANITPAALTVTAQNQTKYQGETFSFDGTEFNSLGLVAADSIANCTITSEGAASGAAEGTYAINISNATGGTFNSSNYNTIYVNGTLTVDIAAPTRLELTGPATILKDGLGAYTLTSQNDNNQTSPVSEDTTFSLSSNTSGNGAFYSDAIGATSTNSATIVSGQNSTTVYYRDNTFGTPTITATQSSGMALGSDSKDIRVSGNNALSFDGTDEYVDCGNDESLQISGTHISIEAWIYPESFDADVWSNVIVEKADNGEYDDTGTGYILRCGNGQVNFTFGIGPDPCWVVATSETNTLSTGKWQHVAATYDGSNIRLFVDGVEKLVQAETTSIVKNDTTSLRIGESEIWPGRHFHGKIDEVRIWNDTCSATEIRANMHRQLQGNEDNLVAYYKMDTGEGTTAKDSGPNGHDGTLTGGPSWQTSGAMSGPGNALDFDGTDDYVDLGNNCKPTSALTLECWVNADNWTGASVNESIAGNTQSGGYNIAVYTTDKVGFAVYSDGDYRGVECATTGMTGWHHVVGTFDGQYTKLYFDGVLKDTEDMGSSGNTITYDNDNHTLLGAEAGAEATPDAGHYYNGLLDEVRFWNTARTAAQIQDNMARTLQGDESGLMAYYRMDQQAVAGQTTLFDQAGNGNNGTLTSMDAASDWLASTAFNTWIGSESNAWATAANWSRAAAPGATDNVGIPDYSDTTGYPTGNAPAISDDPTVNHFALGTDADTTLSSDLTANANLILNNAFAVGTNTVTVAGTTVNTGTLSISTGTLDCNGPFDASSGSTTFTDAGDLMLASTHNLGTFTKGTGTVTFYGTSAQTITGTFNPYNLTIDNAAGVDATGATLTVDNDLEIMGGSTFTSASDYKTVYIRGTFNLSGDITVSGCWLNDGTFNPNDNAVTLDGANQYIEGDSTFYDLAKTVTSEATLMFQAGSTTTITNTLDLQGESGQLLSLRSASAGTQWSIDPQGTRTIGYLDVKDSKNTSETCMDAEDYNCVDSGNNNDWFGLIAPTVTTQAATNVAETTATGNGNITSLGLPNPTAHGVCWSGTANPTTADANANHGAAVATGEFSTGIVGLAPGTTYHVRAWATNTAGTAYGADVSFTTTSPPSPPPSPAWYVVTFNLDGKGIRTGGGALVQSVQGSSSASAPSVQANAGYAFTGWDCSFSNVQSSMTVTAQYAVMKLTLSYNAGAGGTIVGTSPQTVNYGLSGSPVTASPLAGYRFRSWSDGSTANPRIDTNITSDVSVKAVFSKLTYQLTVQSGSGDGAYAVGTVISITADSAADGMIFDKWTGQTANIANLNLADTTLTMPESDVTVTAAYKEKPVEEFILTVMDGTGDGTYETGTVVSISAEIAPDGMIFDKWTGQAATIANTNLANTWLTMPESDVTVTATYRQKPVEKFILNVNSGTGDGEYNAGRIVSIAATPAEEGLMFHRWTGQTANVANVNIPNTTITMPAGNVQVKAVYKADPFAAFALEIRTQTQGNRLRIASKSSVRDGKIESIPAGRLITLIAPDPPEGYVFDKWTGQTEYITNINLPGTTMYMPDQDVVVIATYRPLPAEVILSVVNGSGSGIYVPETVVPIMADPAPDGEMFDKWTGQSANVMNINLPDTRMVMSGVDVTVQAVYCEMPGEVFELEVVNGSGSGSYPAASLVEITADPAPEGYAFDKWQGQNATVEDILSAETFVFIPPSEVMIIAVYIETGQGNDDTDPDVDDTDYDENDTDQDGVLDAWEIDNYGDISLSADDYNALDTDGDGYTDLEEYGEDTDIRVPDNLIDGYLVLMNDTGYQLGSGSRTKVYGNTQPNHLIIKKGAAAECSSFPGENIFTLPWESWEFRVSRSGAAVSLDGPGHTTLAVPATTTGQTIVFSDGSAVLKIEDGSVHLGDQIVTTVSTSVSVALGIIPEITEHPSGDIINPDACLLLMGDASYTMRQGSTTEIYGSSAMNTLNLEGGAAARLYSFSNANTFSIGADSGIFTVFRSGVTMSLSGSDGTLLIVGATLTPQEIRFTDKVLDLKIESGRVMLGEQLVELDPAPVE